MGEAKGLFQRLRRVMLKEREREVATLQKLQSYRNGLLDAYFYFMTNMGEEFFYITFLPGSCWYWGNRESCHFATLMLFFCIGWGNWLKNVFLIPRPPVPRVWTPEGVQKSDHGFPSTHTISFIAGPLYFLAYQFIDKSHKVPQYPLDFTTSAILTAIFSLSIVYSRLYNGYHSPLDVLGGTVFGFVILAAYYYSFRHWLDTLIMWNSFAALFLPFATGFTFVALHPRPPEPTAALPESGMVFGTTAGTIMGSQAFTLFDFRKILGPAYVISNSSPFHFLVQNDSTLQFARFMIGMLIVAIVRHFGKKTLTKVFSKMYPDPKDANWVTTLVKFFNYMLIAWSITFPIEMFFYCTGLGTSYDLRPVTTFPTGYPD